MSAYSRKKGHDLERITASEFRDMGWDKCMTKRQARGGDWSLSDDGVDLVGTYPYLIQCKRLAGYVSVNTIKEIQRQFEEEVPVLITRENNGETMAVLPWEALKSLLAKVSPKNRTDKL